MTPPLSNVTITSDGVGYRRSAVLVDGFPIDGVTCVSFDLDAGDVARARIDVVGVRTGEPVELDPSTPIYDELLAELEHVRTFNEYAGRTP